MDRPTPERILSIRMMMDPEVTDIPCPCPEEIRDLLLEIDFLTARLAAAEEQINNETRDKGRDGWL